MKDYISINDISNKIKSTSLAITYKGIDAKASKDMEKVCSELGLKFENLTSNVQIHSDIVNSITRENIGEKKDGDALITNLKDVPLLIFTADCVPVAIIDEVNKAVGLAHAGWKGTFSEIAKNTLEEMTKNYKTKPEDVVCIIGPSIGPCCYEVSQDLIEKFNTILTNTSEKFYIIKEGKYYLDLWKINEYILLSNGVKKENIINLNLCTSCNEDKFHSYRKHNQTKERIGMLVQIK